MKTKFKWEFFESGLSRFGKVILISFCYLVLLAVPMVIVGVMNKETNSISLIPSQYSTTEIYGPILKQAAVKFEKSDSPAVVINHHLLGGALAARALQRVATDAEVTLVVVSPNHFWSGTSSIISATGEYATPYGSMQTDKYLVRLLGQASGFSLSTSSIAGDHGITAITPLLKNYFPKAELVPLLLRGDAKENDLNRLNRLLSSYKEKPILLISSVDFSHYMPEGFARIHDIYSKQVLAFKNDLQDFRKLEVDSPEALFVLQSYCLAKGFSGVEIWERSSSASLSNKYLEPKENTSWSTGGCAHFENNSAGLYGQTLTIAPIIPDEYSKDFNFDNLPNYKLEQIVRSLTGTDATVILSENTASTNTRNFFDSKSNFSWVSDELTHKLANGVELRQVSKLDLVKMKKECVTPTIVTTTEGNGLNTQQIGQCLVISGLRVYKEPTRNLPVLKLSWPPLLDGTTQKMEPLIEKYNFKF